MSWVVWGAVVLAIAFALYVGSVLAGRFFPDLGPKDKPKPLWRVEYVDLGGGCYDAHVWRADGGGRVFSYRFSVAEWGQWRLACDSTDLAEFVEIPLDDPAPVSGWRPAGEGTWEREVPWGGIIQVYEPDPHRWRLRGFLPDGRGYVDGSMRGAPMSRVQALHRGDEWVQAQGGAL